MSETAGSARVAAAAVSAAPQRPAMQLRLRLFLIFLGVTLSLLAAVLVASYGLQQNWLERNRARYERQFLQVTGEFGYARLLAERDPAAPSVVRAVLDPNLRQVFRSWFGDLLIRSGSTIRTAVDLSPLGAQQREPDFPLLEVREGIRQAMEERRLVRAADGFCIAIPVGDRVVGGAWFRPRLPPPPPLPFGVFAIPVVVAMLFFAAIAHFVLERGLVRPLRELRATAARFGSGDYGVRAGRSEVAELASVLSAFDAMAERIEGHHAELEREVRRATEEAKRKERALLQSARLASMGTLAAGIAHEINNPIGGMANALRRFDNNEHLDERDRVYLDLIRDGLDRIGRIARRVLDFSPRSEKALPFGLRAAVDGARALVEHRSRHQAVEIDVELPADLPDLFGDRHEFQQVLLNLFLNSLDVLEGRDPPGRIEVRARALGDQVEIVVRDDGPGMPRDQLPRVVDPFFSAKGRADASGLGLFISASIVRNLGGEMSFESDLGAGFEVRVVLPRAGAGDASLS